MINFFQKIRKQLAAENKPKQYLRYAIGEILLVVIGILVALQINNWNEQRIQRENELRYLVNIKTDLNLNIKDLDKYLAKRKTQIESANIILEHHDGKPLTDLVAFNNHCTDIYIWQRFNLNNNTFQELLNSGNLAIISNDTLKKLLLNLESVYKKMKDGEDHFRYDSEKLLYDPIYELLDMNPTVKSYVYHLTNGHAGENVTLPREDFENLLKNIKHKNGMVMAVYEFGVMKGKFEEMKKMSNHLIELIDQELKAE